VVEDPSGLQYREGFLTVEEESKLLHLLEGIRYGSVEMHGRTARRSVAEFGYAYGFEDWTLVPSEPLPSAMMWLRERCADPARVEAGPWQRRSSPATPRARGSGGTGTLPCSAPRWSACLSSRSAGCDSSAG
jgi:hypothetical protein